MGIQRWQTNGHRRNEIEGDSEVVSIFITRRLRMGGASDGIKIEVSTRDSRAAGLRYCIMYYSISFAYLHYGAVSIVSAVFARTRHINDI